MYGKKPLTALTVLFTLVLAGCGGGGGDSGSTTTSNTTSATSTPIADSTSGGNAKDEAAYKKLKNYVEFLDKEEYLTAIRFWSRYYYPINSNEEDNLKENLLDKNFKQDECWYKSTAQSNLPKAILGAEACIEYDFTDAESGYSVGLHMTTYPDIAGNDALFDSVFGPFDKESFRRLHYSVIYYDNLTVKVDNIIDTIKNDKFTCSGIYNSGIKCIENTIDYRYSLYFRISTLGSDTVSSVAIELEKQL
ncbi:MAG: hypothetical protein LBD84_01065 [Campylobacteraceae bacterium]|jgi:hypothetical protein|nr:hypothetical protein [Campylobacteraceae bacterium]